MDFHRSFGAHAHFYQPPREDPLTDEIPAEPSASPYHDWNERIFQTCYLPNIQIGNFSCISYNIGPTLARWLRVKHPEAFQRIVQADRENYEKYGHGNAIAQPYHHTILPLATRQEKETEIAWGIVDFVHDFGRKPEGMWLAETAVDTETLWLLAEQGIKFTILAPWQLKSAEEPPHPAYRILLPQGREIVAFVYNRELSTRVSFDGSATLNADRFVADFVRKEFSLHPNTEYMLVASDGELYGHHQEFREMFLSQLVNGSLREIGITPQWPAAWLDGHPQLPVADLHENTSWSCHHGVKRWQEECACTPGAAWKRPLRDVVTAIAGEVDRICAQHLEQHGLDLHVLRKDYIRVCLEERPFPDWIKKYLRNDLTVREYEKLGKIFRAQEFRLRMFVSCAWFFEDLDRIEPRNCIAYAAYALWLLEDALGIQCSQQYHAAFSKVKSAQGGLSAAMVFDQAIAHYQAGIVN
jgi:hypothetical protein